jgi:hypothetical protein
VTVIVDEPDAVTEAGLKLGIAPIGNPLAVKITAPLNPPDGVTVAVYVVLAPWTTVCEAGVAETEKSGVAGALQARIALLTLRRPFVRTRPVSDPSVSTLFNRLLFTPAVSSEHLESTSAAAPAT